MILVKTNNGEIREITSGAKEHCFSVMYENIGRLFIEEGFSVYSLKLKELETVGVELARQYNGKTYTIGFEVK